MNRPVTGRRPVALDRARAMGGRLLDLPPHTLDGIARLALGDSPHTRPAAPELPAAGPVASLARDLAAELAARFGPGGVPRRLSVASDRRAVADAVTELRAVGMSTNDISGVLGVSVDQIRHATREATR